jgi:hypothetical protein
VPKWPALTSRSADEISNFSMSTHGVAETKGRNAHRNDHFGGEERGPNQGDARPDILLAFIMADNHIPIFITKKLTTTRPMIINRPTLALVNGVIRIIRNVRTIRINRVVILQ